LVDNSESKGTKRERERERERESVIKTGERVKGEREKSVLVVISILDSAIKKGERVKGKKCIGSNKYSNSSN
jgi:hypothetical protein